MEIRPVRKIRRLLQRVIQSGGPGEEQGQVAGVLDDRKGRGHGHRNGGGGDADADLAGQRVAGGVGDGVGEAGQAGEAAGGGEAHGFAVGEELHEASRGGRGGELDRADRRVGVAGGERGKIKLDRRARGGFEAGQGQPGEVVVEAGVAVRVGIGVGVGEIVRGRGGVGAVEGFPPIGEAVCVGVETGGARDGRVILPAADVGLGIGQTWITSVGAGAGVGVGAGEGFADHAGVVVVEGAVGADIREHAFVGTGGGLGGDK